MTREAFALISKFDVMIEPCASVGHEGWLSLRQALWPHRSKVEHIAEMTAILGQTTRFAQFVAYGGAHKAVGFVEASIRGDYVNGTHSSPVAFLEGIYVQPKNRCRGIARILVGAVSVWAVARGCREFASDAALGNELSHEADKSLGFLETERVVYFCKILTPSV